MPCIKSFFGMDLVHGARIVEVYTVFITLLMGAGAIWYYREHHSFQEHPICPYFIKDCTVSYITNQEEFLLQMGISYTIAGLILLAGSICLHVAVSYKNPRLFWPWYIIYAIVAINFIVRYAYQGLYRKMMDKAEPFTGLIIFPIGFIFYIVLCSYKEQLLDIQKQQATRQPPITVHYQQYPPDGKYYPTPYTVQPPFNLQSNTSLHFIEYDTQQRYLI